ncbi:MAG: hypothetical protein ACI9TH_002886 [Kiritimatiellia bacterium]|jgi:hypothetical protein
MPLALKLQLLATLYMTGLIWFVQLVHYPMFAEVAAGDFPRYEAVHNTRTSWAVMPAMLIELAVVLYLVFAPASPWSRPMASTGLALLVLIWLSTFLLQVPCHTRLMEGFDADVHRKLVLTNWVRTVAWSLRAALVLRML